MKALTSLLLMVGGFVVITWGGGENHALGGTILYCTGAILAFMRKEKT